MNVAEQPFAAELELPRVAQMEPVGECALSIRSPAFMSFDAYARLLAQFPRLERLVLQGRGDPLAHPRFCDMVRAAAERGAEVAARSPLTVLSEKRAEEIVLCGLRRLEVLVDPRTPQRSLRHAGRLQAVKRRLGLAAPEVRIVAVAMRRNIAHLAKLVELAHAQGVPVVQLRHLVHDYSNTRRLVAAETLIAETSDVFAEARATAERLGLSLELPAAPSGGRCDRPWNAAYINFYGRAMPCEVVRTSSRLGFGSMLRDGVARIWSNDEYRAFREGLASGKPPEVCSGCSYYAA